ncbi:hypothetical protein BLOT_006905 [Blomia tropicalis]|nr:hypothetical protein BLOT_006905 [Blomia tropicalis]
MLKYHLLDLLKNVKSTGIGSDQSAGPKLILVVMDGMGSDCHLCIVRPFVEDQSSQSGTGINRSINYDSFRFVSIRFNVQSVQLE